MGSQLNRNRLLCFNQVLELTITQNQHWLKSLMTSSWYQTVDVSLYLFYSVLPVILQITALITRPSAPSSPAWTPRTPTQGCRRSAFNTISSNWTSEQETTDNLRKRNRSSTVGALKDVCSAPYGSPNDMQVEAQHHRFFSFADESHPWQHLWMQLWWVN